MTRTARFIRFGGVGLAGVLVQLGTLAALTNGLGVHYTLATPLAVAAAVVHNFAWHWRWTWRDRETKGGLLRTFAAFALTNGVVSLAGNEGAMAILAGKFGVPAVPANVLAIVACSLVNFALADTVVFARRSARRAATGPALPYAAMLRRLLS